MNFERYYDVNRATIVVALNKSMDHKERLKDILYTHFITHKVIVWHHANDPILEGIIPFLREQGPIDGHTTLYICHEGFCKKPLTSIDEMEKAIKNL